MHTINITDQQAEDRLDDAIQYMQTFLGDGTERRYYKHEFMDSVEIARLNNSNDPHENYIELPATIQDVLKIFPLRESFTNGIFSIKYQLFLNDIYNLRSAGDTLTDYVMTRQNIEFIQNIINGETPIRFNRHSNRVYIDHTWANTVRLNDVFLFEVFEIVDPETYNEMYDDLFLKKYATALIKLQWGQNLMKYGGVQLPGGIELNGETIAAEAREEIEQVEEDARLTWELPIDFLTG